MLFDNSLLLPGASAEVDSGRAEGRLSGGAGVLGDSRGASEIGRGGGTSACFKRGGADTLASFRDGDCWSRCWSKRLMNGVSLRLGGDEKFGSERTTGSVLSTTVGSRSLNFLSATVDLTGSRAASVVVARDWRHRSRRATYAMRPSEDTGSSSDRFAISLALSTGSAGGERVRAASSARWICVSGSARASGACGIGTNERGLVPAAEPA